MKWFQFNQNNSGGKMVVNDQVSDHVFIQAPSADAANSLAERIGIYFNGVADGNDCECCGDRWSEQIHEEGDLEPLVWGRPLSDESTVRIYPFTNQSLTRCLPVSIEDFKKNPPMVIEPS